MKKIKYLVSSLFAIVFMLALVACTGDKNGTTTTTGTETPSTTPSTNVPSTTPSTEDETVTYEVVVEARSGKRLKDFMVSISAGNQVYGEKLTDNTGTVTFELKPNNYKISVYENEGYILYEPTQTTTLVDSSYLFTLDTELIDHEAEYGNTYELGDVMYDFTVTDTNNQELTLSDLLQDYDAVMLNFWYTTCTYCLQEFPAIEQAYNSKYTDSSGAEKSYSDSIAILAVNPTTAGNQDTLDDVAGFKEQYGYTFDFCVDYDYVSTDVGFTPALTSMFNVTGFPTTVVIDRFANIAYFQSGYCTDTEKWTGLFDEYIGVDYTPIYTGTGAADEDKPLPNVDPVAPELIAQTINGVNYDGSQFVCTYSGATGDDAEYNWPWIISEDGNSIVPSNSGVNNSYSILNISVNLKEGEVLSFNYHASTESYDVLYVIINDAVATEISGQSPSGEFEKCYSYVALYEDTYNISLCYLKDATTHSGEDKIYLNNIHICEIDDIDKETYILREASYGDLQDFTASWEYYAEVVYNEEDGYYHVGSGNGPLLFVDLLGLTHWDDKNTLYQLCLADPSYAVINDVDYYKTIELYASLCSNSPVGYCPVTQDLKVALQAIVNEHGSEYAKWNENQWLELCVYYSAYNIENLESPIKGLATFDAFQFDENNESSATFDRLILPRGYIFEFVPEKSGVYGVYTVGNLNTIVWVCDDLGNPIFEDDKLRSDQAVNEDGEAINNPNAFSYQYYEAGKSYYIRAAFDDLYEFSTITVKYEYIAETTEKLIMCSEPVFTSSDENMSDIISVGVDVYLDEDGFYHVTDSKASDTLVYFDAAFTLEIFGTNYNKLLNANGFDFTKDELNNSRVNENGYLLMPQLYYYTEEGNAVNADMNNLDDGITYYVLFDANENIVYSDKYYTYEDGTPIIMSDLTESVKQYVDTYMISDKDSDMYGLVKVDETFANVLQLLMDKYTFEGVENSWLKLCYYLEFVGPATE